MDSVYTKPLMIISLLLVLTVGLFVLQHLAQKELKEGFAISDTSVNQQKEFLIMKFREAKGGDAAVDVLNLPNPDDVKKATEDIDLFVKRQKPGTKDWYTDVENSEIYKKEKACQAMKLPESLPEDRNKQRLDCTWMYNPNGQSGAALASITGPVFTLAQRKYPSPEYQLTWSKEEAIKKERIKTCALTTKCDLLVPGNRCGFCPELNRAVPVDNNGNSIYNEARCPAQPVMDPKNCRKPRSEGGGGYNTTTCDVDDNGNLSKACLTEVARMSGLWDGGTILQALRDSSTPDTGSQTVREAAEVLKRYNYSIPDNLLTNGNVTVDTALNTYQSISQAFWSNWWWNPNNTRNSRVANASGNLMWGMEFNPCGYEDSSVEDFKLKCLRDLYQSGGCQGRGSDFPNEKNIKSFWGKPWGDVKKGLNELVNMMTNQNGQFSADQQKDAIRRCIGTRLRRRATTYCNELGVAVYMYYDSPNGTFFGRKIITNMFFGLQNDSKFWDTLDIFTSPLTGGRRIYLVLKTNFNPDSAATLSYNKVSNFVDLVKWNDKVIVNKTAPVVTVDPVNGLVVSKNEQNSQRLEINIMLDYGQYSQRSGFWYMTDSTGAQPPISICRLPIERKNPIMNIVMNYGDVVEATGNVGIQPTNCRSGTLGDEACTLFSGNTWIRVGNALRTRAFRSYTMKVWCNNLDNRDSFFSFYNGKWEQRNEIRFWIVIPLGFFIWIPIPIFHLVWRYYPEDWWKSSQRIEMVTGSYNDSLEANVKPDSGNWPSINAKQSGVIKPKTWQHFTWIWNGDWTAVDVYLDGVKIMTGSGTSMGEQITNENFIGRSAVDNDHRMHNGGMQWFRGFDYPLTKEEIAQDMDDDW
jgi:hypothetical protein